MRRVRPVALVLFVAMLVSATPALASQTHDYLALGDSVAFGFNPLLFPSGASNPANFVGYPEALAATLPLDLTNASCPGEASGGFISLASPLDNGCRPYRGVFPLHAAYTSSQLDFAVAYLAAHPQTKLITIDLGANDLFHLQHVCADNPSCISAGLPATLATLGTNLRTIYATLRAAGFHGRLVALTYYSLDYRDANVTAVVAAVNVVVASATLAQPAGAVADGFAAFAAASAPSGSPCAAGLLIALPSGGCDIHPSATGRDLLARAIREVVRASGD